MSPTRPRLGLVLGGGAARGWAHIGVIRTLEAHRLPIDVVCGSSIGALVGGAYAAGRLDALAEWVRELDRIDVVRLMDPALKGGGFLLGSRLMEEMAGFIPGDDIRDLPMPYACTATDLRSGRELWLREGSLREAVRASIALPGLFTPVRRDNRWVADGGLTNPVPVSLARSFDVDLVVAVNLNTGLVGRHLGKRGPRPGEAETLPEGLQRLLDSLPAEWTERARSLLARAGEREEDPGLLDVTASAINIMQDQITRSRLAGDPPDVIVAPRLQDVALMDFHRAATAIAAGERAGENAIPAITALLQEGA